jgi:hypothetical protein
MLALRLVPAPVMADCRARADEALAAGKPVSWLAAGVIVAVWVALAVGVVVAVARVVQR